jgi:hypothetical protein
VLDVEVLKLKEINYSKMRKIPTDLDEKYDQFE